MHNFWTLVAFEYKKIIKRKSFIIAVIIMIFASTFCMVGDILMHGYAYEKTERELQHSVAGYIDNAMITDVILKNVEVRDKIDENGNYEVEVYDNNIRPYHTLRSYIARINSPVEFFDFENFNRLDNAEGIDFYELRTKSLHDKLTLANIDEKEINHTLELNSKLENPFYIDYYSGYEKFLFMMSTSSVFILLALSMCIAPIFADEFQMKTDAVILSSKYGKNKLITAKMFTTISFSLFFIIAALVIALATIFLVYGTYGGNVSYQVSKLYSVYPLTMAQAVLIYCIIILATSLLISALCLLLSAKYSAFTTITTLMLVLIGSMFFNIPLESLRTFNFILPAKMMNESYIFSERLVSFCGMYLKPYHFIFAFCFFLIVILLPLSYKSFKNHQIG